MTLNPHIEARIEFVATDKGGREGPAYSGYRGQFYYNCNDWVAVQTFIDRKEANPGETVEAMLRFMSPKEYWRNVSIGMPFLVREGNKTVAFGSVTKIFDALEIDANKDE